MTISKEDAIASARRSAEERGWRWEQPIRVTRSRRFVLFGRVTYEIWTNAAKRGSNARFFVDGEDGSVRKARWLPR